MASLVACHVTDGQYSTPKLHERKQKQTCLANSLATMQSTVLQHLLALTLNAFKIFCIVAWPLYDLPCA